MLQTFRPTPTCTRFQTSIEMPCIQSGQKIDIAAADPLTRLPAVGEAGDKETTTAIDNCQRRLVIITASATAVTKHQRSPAVAPELNDVTMREIVLAKVRLVHRIERLR